MKEDIRDSGVVLCDGSIIMLQSGEQAPAWLFVQRQDRRLDFQKSNPPFLLSHQQVQ